MLNGLYALIVAGVIAAICAWAAAVAFEGDFEAAILHWQDIANDHNSLAHCADIIGATVWAGGAYFFGRMHG